MAVNGRPLKRPNRRVTADLCDFQAFGGDGAAAAAAGRDLHGPYRASVKAFIEGNASLPGPPPIPTPPLVTWRVAFRVGEEGTAAAELDVVEEDVARSRST